jgi:hypothetical protein
MSRKRVIEFEYEDKKFALVSPTQKDALDMDMAYRRAFSRAVREGLMTEFEAKRTFERNGTWSDKQETEIQQMQMKIVGLEMELDKVDAAGPEGRGLCFQIMETRTKLLELINYKTNLFSKQTAEGYAEAVKLAALAQLCTVDEAGEQVFHTHEMYATYDDDAFAALCYSKAMILHSGLHESDFNFKAPERKWLEEQGYISEDGVFTKQYYAEVLDVKKAKKKTRKKTAKKRRKKVKA